MAAPIKDVKQFLFDFYRQRHFDLMPDEVRARYDDYSKRDDFNGNMKWWKKELMDSTTGSNNPLPTLDVSKQQDLFELLQAALQGMDADKDKYNHNKPVKDFIEKWFGTFRPFNASKAINSDVRVAIGKIDGLLHAARPAFERIFKGSIITDEFSYDDLLDGIAKGKYDSDIKFRDRLLKIVEHILYYGETYGSGSGYSNPDVWPDNLDFPKADFDALALPGLGAPLPRPGGVNDWFKAVFNQPRFESIYPVVLSELLEKENIRKEFEKYESSGKIIAQLNKAIDATDYDNLNSKDFVPAKATDEKTVGQKLKDWGDKTYESYLRKFTEPGRGTRLYFTPFSQEIMKAIDKEKIKPTDGIAGIMAKKDAILKRLSASSPTAKKHFDWFAKTMGDISNLIPSAYAGAMKGGRQLQAVVSQVIIAAVKADKIAEAKTALEILAVSKYGFTTSRTMDALAKENISVFSDKGLSWNKNDGMQFVTNAMDKTLKYGIQAVGRTAAAVRNEVRRRNTKFDGDIRTNKDLSKAYKTWQDEDGHKLDNEKAINAAHDVDARLDDFANGRGRSGRVIDAGTIDAVQAALDAMTSTDPGYADLKADIEQYKSFAERKDLVDNWRAKNKDNYHDLVAYWDLMMSAMKTHSFRLGTTKARAAFLKNDNAKNVANQFIADYGNLRA